MYDLQRGSYWVRSLVLLLVFCGACHVTWAQGQKIIFSATGDVPYGSSEVTVFEQQIANHNKYSPSAFFVHVGDILSGGAACNESVYSTVSGIMKDLAVPAYISPGDNETVDCSSPSSGFNFFMEYFQNFEQNFCGAPFTDHQGAHPENWAFTMNGVLFIGINLVYGSNADQHAADWVIQQFEAKGSQVRAAAVFAHFAPDRSTTFSTPFRSAAAAFGKPVLFLHGHGHKWSTGYPFSENNIFRVQVDNGGAEDPVEVTVTMNTSSPEAAFTFKRDPWSSKTFVNMPPCADAGPDQTISGSSTTLQGSATDDGDNGSTLTTTWSKVSGPGTVLFGNVHALTTTAIFSVNGIYVLRLTANDGQLEKTDEVTIGVSTPLNNVPVISSFSPTSGVEGALVTIWGSDFTGANTVTFNSTPATSFTINSDTQIETTVPAGATTGKITVTNSFGTGVSIDDFVVPTGGSSTTSTYYPTHDAYVESLNPTNNYGSAIELRAETNSASDVSNIYSKFNVSGLSTSVQSAKLRFRCTDPSSQGGSIFLVSNNYQGTGTPWIEGGLNWSNAPVISSSALSTVGSVSSGQIVEFDVTAAITGNGIYSFALTNNSTNSVWYNSKESANPPALIIQTSGTIVHEEIQTGGSSSLTTVTTSANLTGVNGHLYLAAISTRPRKLVQSVTGLGLNWTLVKSICSGNNSTTGMDVWMAQGTPSGNGAVTATFWTAPSTAVIAVSRYSGVAAMDPIGNVIAGNVNGLDGACNGGVDDSAYSFNLTTSVNDATIYGAVALKARTHTPGAGYTEWSEFQYPNAVNPIGVAVEGKNVASASTVAVNGSFDGPVDWALVAFVIKPQGTQHTLMVNNVGSGSVALNPPGGTYDVGTEVTLTATPATGYQFSGWSGDLSGVTNPTTITMNGNKSVTATFTAISSSNPIVYKEIQTGGSSGSVTVTTSANLTGASGNLYLAAISSRPRKIVQSVTGLGLTWTLVKSICSGNDGTTMMDVWMAQGIPQGGSNGKVTATFWTAPSTAVIAVSRYSGVAAADPVGNVIAGNVIGLEGACSGGVDNDAYSFNLTTTVNNTVIYAAAALKARTHTPGAGYTELLEFQYPHAINPIGVAVEGKSVASASTVAVNGSFDGPVDWALVALVIKPQGAQHTLTVNTVGSGTVSLNPPGGTYNAGVVVTLTATPAAGYQFSGWSGDLSGTANPTTITMDGNKNVTATFTAIPWSGPIVYEESQTGGASSSVTVTTSANLTGVSGNLYLAAISSRPRKLVQSVSGLGLNWTLVKSTCSGNNSTTGMDIWMAQGTPSGNGKVTATFWTAPSTAVIAVSRYSGVAASNPVGNVIGGNTNGLNGACSGGVDGNAYSFNLATTVNDAVIYAAVALKARTHTPGAGYAERLEFQYPHAVNPIGMAVEGKNVASPSTVTVNGSFDGPVDWAVVALVIKPQGAITKSSETAENQLAENFFPAEYQLEQNYPNPFSGSGISGRSSTQIAFSLPAASRVTVNIYNQTGQLVRTLVDGEMAAGRHKIYWNGKNQIGGSMTSGVYLYKLVVSGQNGEAAFTQTKRMTLLK